MNGIFPSKLLTIALLVCAAPVWAVEPTEQKLPPWKPLVIPRALVAVGPWGDEFRWREALHQQGILYEDAYRLQNGYHRPSVQMVNMPAADAELREFSVIVLANVDAPALGPERLAAIQRFVEQGGGLVVLGGYWAYSRGGYAGTPLEVMLPVTFPPQNRIPARSPGAVLTRDATGGIEANFAVKPRVYFLQQLVPRPNAVIAIRAGEEPALVTGKFSRGRVAACGLTVHGKPGADEIPFWDWPEWPRVLGQTIEWTAANRPLRDPAAQAAILRPLTDDEIEQVRLNLEPVDDPFVAPFVASPSREAAEAVFEHWFGEEAASGAISSAAIDALARFAKPQWEARLLLAADGLNADRGRRRAAIELLGASQTPDAAKVLEAALADDDVAPAAVDGLRRMGDNAQLETLQRVYKRSLSLADFRHPAAEAANDAAATRHGTLAVHAAAALYHLGENHGVERMVELYAEIRLLRRVFANATKRRVVETDATGIALRNAIAGKQRDFAALEAYLFAFAGPVPRTQQSAFLTVANGATGDAEVRWLAAALLASPGESWPLDKAHDGTLRRLGATLGKQ